MTKYRLSPEEKDDLVWIYNYGITQFGQAHADLYLSELLNCFEHIVKNPNQYPSVNHIVAGYHRCVHKADSIYFRVNTNTVEIMAVIGRQDFG